MKRLIKKSDRLAVQTANIEYLKGKGWNEEIYKGLKIYTHDDKEKGNYSLKIYRDTAAEAVINYYYRKEENRTKQIADSRQSYDYHEERKAKEKANPTHSTAANCAQAIREELKKYFPGVKFTVRSENFSMGNSVNIGWIDGPTADQVTDHTSKYQYGHFNGMEDIYENSNSRDDIPQAKFVQESRTMGEDTRKVLEAAAAEAITGEGWEEDRRRQDFIREVWYKTAIKAGAKVTGIEHTAETCGRGNDLYTLKTEGGQETIAPTSQATAPAGTVQIIEHPKKKGLILVIGETYKIRHKLKEIGGHWNKWEKGWEYQAGDVDRIAATLTAPTLEEVERTEPIEEPSAEESAPGAAIMVINRQDEPEPSQASAAMEETARALQTIADGKREDIAETLKDSAAELVSMAAEQREAMRAKRQEIAEEFKKIEAIAPEIGTSRDGFFRISGPTPKMTAHGETGQIYLF